VWPLVKRIWALKGPRWPSNLINSIPQREEIHRGLGELKKAGQRWERKVLTARAGSIPVRHSIRIKSLGEAKGSRRVANILSMQKQEKEERIS